MPLWIVAVAVASILATAGLARVLQRVGPRPGARGSADIVPGVAHMADADRDGDSHNDHGHDHGGDAGNGGDGGGGGE